MSDGVTPGVTPGVWTHAKSAVSKSHLVLAGEHEKVIASLIVNEADARLMAASKRMLAALQYIAGGLPPPRIGTTYDREYIHTTTVGLVHMRHAHSAIRAATGTDHFDASGADYGEAPPGLSDGQALAFAVLDGDDVAALALADEVRERLAEPEGFVPRAELLRRIAELETTCREQSEELHRMNDPQDDGRAACRLCDRVGPLSDAGFCSRCAFAGVYDEDDEGDGPDARPAPPRRVIEVMTSDHRFPGMGEFLMQMEVAPGVGDIAANQPLANGPDGRLVPCG